MQTKVWSVVAAAVLWTVGAAVLGGTCAQAAQAQALKTCRGNITGDINGVLELTVRGTKVTGLFTGRHKDGKSGSFNCTVTGTYNAGTGRVSASLKGYTMATVKGKQVRVNVTGSITGAIKAGAVSATWKLYGKGARTVSGKGSAKASPIAPRRCVPAPQPSGG